MSFGTASPDNIVVLRSVPWKQLQCWLDPVDAVFALGITNNFTLCLPQGLVIDKITVASVVHAKDLAVLENGRVAARVPLPRLIVLDRDLALCRRVQAKFGSALKSFDKRAVDK